MQGDKLDYTEIQRAGVFSGIHCTRLRGPDFLSLLPMAVLAHFFSYQFQVLRSKDFPPAFLEAAFLLIQFAAKQATFPAGADEGRCIEVTLGITALSWGMTSNYSERCSI